MLLIIKSKPNIIFIVLTIMIFIGGWINLSATAQDKIENNQPAQIHFADLGGIDEWRAEGINSMLIKGINGKWFRATFFSECFPLPWSEKVAFVTNPDGTLNRFSSILVNGQQCYFKKFESIPQPESKSSKTK